VRLLWPGPSSRTRDLTVQTLVVTAVVIVLNGVLLWLAVTAAVPAAGLTPA
jgi:hypothetical protein